MSKRKRKAHKRRDALIKAQRRYGVEELPGTYWIDAPRGRK